MYLMIYVIILYYMIDFDCDIFCYNYLIKIRFKSLNLKLNYFFIFLK